MKWLKVSDYYAETDCGTYRCRKYRTGEDVLNDPGELRYQLYGPNGQRLGPSQESFAACRKWLEGSSDMSDAIAYTGGLK